MTRVLYLTPGCFDKGGISRYNRFQITAFRDLLGYDAVSVFSVLGPDSDSFETPFETNWAASGLSRTRKLTYVARSILHGLKTRPSIVLAAHVNLAGLGKVISKLAGALLVLNVYGVEVWSGLRRDAEWGLRTADWIISDCHFTARYLVDAGYRAAATMDVIWDCVDPVRFSPGPPRDSVINRYGIPSPASGLNLLTFGRMTFDALYKGYERLLDVFAIVAPDVPNLRLVYAGHGDLNQSLRAKASERGLGGRVFFLGGIHEDHLVDVYRAGHIFSLVGDRGVGRGEGIPLTPLEAAACGLPILVGNHDGSQEAVVEGQNGFIHDPFDLESQARSVAALATDQSKRAHMSEAARARIEAEFSYPKFRWRHQEAIRGWPVPTGRTREF